VQARVLDHGFEPLEEHHREGERGQEHPRGDRQRTGEAAGEVAVARLLVGLGVDELSVAPARLDELRDNVRRLSFADAAEAAQQAVAAASAREALALSAELRNETGQVLGGLGGAVT